MADTDPIVFTRAQGRRLVAMLHDYEAGKLNRPLGQRRNTGIAGGGADGFDALITGNRELESSPNNRWEYSWVEAMFDPVTRRWGEKPDGRTSTIDGDPFGQAALNGFENNNDGSGVEGLGARVGIVGPAERTMLPINAGVCVRMRKGLDNDKPPKPLFSFAAPNPFDVECVNP